MEAKLIVTPILVVAFITFIVKLLNWIWFRPRKLEKFLRKQGLNGNPYRILVGDLKDVTRVMDEEQPRSLQLSDDILPHIFSYYLQMISKYGENSFVWFGPWPTLNVVDPELIKEILRKPNLYQKPFPEILKIIAAGGVFLLEGEKWAKHRKIINPAFHMEKLKNMVPAIGLSCSNMIEKWKTALVSGSNQGFCEIDVWQDLQYLTGDVISRTAFGSSYEEGRTIFQLQQQRVELTKKLVQLFFIPGLRYLPTKENKKVKAISDEIDIILRSIIEKRQEEVKRGEATNNDLLGILLESNSKFIEEHGSKNSGLSIEDVIEECKLFYLAGSETTSSLLVWTMILLCKHPEWQTKARDEVIRVFGNSVPTYEGLNHLRCVAMILQEVLRLYPSVILTVRCPTETTKLGNLTIPKGVHLTLLIGLLNYDPKIWGDDVKEFHPQRFSQGAFKESSFIPFSSGPRVCIGQNFATIQAKMAIAMILQQFSFELSPSYVHSPFSVLTTLGPQYGAPLIMRSLESLPVS